MTVHAAPPISEAELRTVAPNDAERNQLIANAAYFRAERRRFAQGDPLQDWVMAEARIAKWFPR